MAKLEHLTKENPRLCYNVLKDGRESLYLEYYMGRKETPIYDKEGNPVFYANGRKKYKVKHTIKKETLGLYLTANPKNTTERENNKQIILLARKIREEKEQELLKQKKGYRLEREKNINFIDFFQNYIDNYTKADIRTLKSSLQRFKDFLKGSKIYSKYVDAIGIAQIDKDMMIAFTEYLKSRGNGTGAKTYYQRFKKVINYALDHEIITKNPCKGVSIKVDENVITKEILSQEEIKQMLSVMNKDERANITIRKAYVISLYCGIRYCDIKKLTYNNIDYSNKLLNYEQSKTTGHSTRSNVTIPLTDDLLNLLGKPQEGQTKESLIFPLPSFQMCIKSIRRWAKSANIEKNITWHSARHSFAVNLLTNNIDIKTTSNLLGHSSLEHTQKYLHVVDNLKVKAINSLPKINI